MANVSIFGGNFFHYVEIEKSAFSNIAHQVSGKNLSGNDYHKIVVVIVTTEIFP